MICAQCGKELPVQAMFCPSCGGSAWGAEPLSCPACGLTVVVSNKFCPHCGISLRRAGQATSASSIRPSPQSPLHRLGPREYVEQLLSHDRKMASERRIVTILFADVVGSTAIADAMDPEDVANIMNGALSVLTQPIGRHGGTLARLMGDAVLCFFGAPVAHEDDPHRACWAALDILFGAERYAEELRNQYHLEGFKVRVGVSTGLAVVGEVGTHERAEYTAMGDAINLASRLQSAAEPGTILISAETWAQANAVFEAEDRGTLAIRGKTEPVHVFRLVGCRASSHSPGGESSGIPMVGREEELASLRDALGPHVDGSGRIVLILGDPGVGKSRLVAEAPLSLRTECVWVEVKCRDTYQFVSYAAARQLLQRLLGVDDSVSPETALEALKQKIDSLTRALRTVGSAGGAGSHTLAIEGTRAALSLLLTESGKSGARQMSESPLAEEVQRQLRTGFCEFLRACAYDKPLVIVWEDLHWIDQESIALLEVLPDVIASAPVTLLLVSRRGSERVSRIARHLQEACGDRFREIFIHPLSRAHSQSLLRSLMPNRSLTPPQCDHILQITEGNAFFLEQMAHTLSTDAPTIETLSIPATVQATILARVDRLSPRDKRVLLAAAIAGRNFPQAILGPVLAGSVPPSDLAESLDSLIRRGFLERTDRRMGSSMPPVAKEDRIELRFVQAMSHEVIYESILRSERRLMHQKAAEAIESLYPEELESMAPELMRHFAAAEQTFRAALYAQMTGDRAVKLHASESALEHYRQAREYAMNAPASTERTVLQRELWARIADVHFSRGNYEDATAAYEKALALSACVHECAEFHRRIASVQEKRGRYNEARISYEAALRLLEGNPNETIAGRIYAGLCLVHYHLNDLPKATELGERAVAMTQASGDRRACAEACSDLAIACTAQGEIARARELYGKCRRIWMQLGDDYGLASCFNNLGCLAKSEQNWQDAIREFSISLELFTMLGNRHAIARVCDNMGEVYFLTGNQEEAERYMARAVSLLAEIGVDGSGVLPEMWQSGVW